MAVAGPGILARLDVAGMPRGVPFNPALQVGDSVDAVRLRDLVERAQDALVDEGYLWSAVTVDTASGEGGMALALNVQAGERALVGGWALEGCDSISDVEVRAVLPGGRMPFTRRNLNASVLRVLRLYESRGFPVAEVRPTSVRDSGRYVFPTLYIVEGGRVVVSFLEFTGTKLPVWLLRRSARFRGRTVYSPRAVLSWRRNLEQSGLVRVASEAIVRGERGYGIRFAVSDRQANRVSGAVGYAPEAEEWSGLVHLRLGNILNTGRRLKAGWSSFRSQSLYHLSYTEPWLLGWWMSLTGSAKQTVRDTTVSVTELAVDVELLLGSDLVASFGTGMDLSAGRDTLDNSRVIWAGTGVRVDTREDQLNPKTGAFIDARTRVGTRSSSGSDDGFLGRFEVDLGAAGPTIWRMVLNNDLHGRWVHSAGDLSEHEQYFLGGANSLRGFREEELSGTKLGWWNTELRYGLGEESAVFPFFNAGVVDGGDGLLLRAGYGAGAMVRTRIGTFEFAYGIPVGGSPLRGKVHFGFAGEF